MTNADIAALTLRMLLTHVPLMLIATIGLYFAVSRRARLARVSTWATWGFGLLIVNAIVGVAIQLTLMAASIEASTNGAGDLASTFSRVGLWSLANYPLFLAAIALLARAIFLDRGPRTPRAGDT